MMQQKWHFACESLPPHRDSLLMPNGFRPMFLKWDTIFQNQVVAGWKRSDFEMSL
jgi:hypothetical protein